MAPFTLVCAAFRTVDTRPQVLTTHLPDGAALPRLSGQPPPAGRSAIVRAAGADNLLGLTLHVRTEADLPPLAAEAPTAWVALDALPPLPLAHAAILRESRAALGATMARRPVCSVVGCKAGSARFTAEVAERAFTAGRLAAEAGYAVLCGGLSGVMEEAARGARAVGGTTVGILPGDDAARANPHCQIVVPSGIGYARNVLVALGCDVMIAVPGGRGTLEEMCFALDFGRLVLSWGSWMVDDVVAVRDADDVAARLDALFWQRLSASPAPAAATVSSEPRATGIAPDTFSMRLQAPGSSTP